MADKRQSSERFRQHNLHLFFFDTIIERGGTVNWIDVKQEEHNSRTKTPAGIPSSEANENDNANELRKPENPGSSGNGGSTMEESDGRSHPVNRGYPVKPKEKV